VVLQTGGPISYNLLEAFVEITHDVTCNASYSGAITVAVKSAGRDGNINGKCDICFVAVKEFVYANIKNLIASTKSNTVQPHV
jgi:hypothetical protein